MKFRQDLLEELICRHHVNLYLNKDFNKDLQVIEYQRNETIIRQGESLNYLYFFLEGKIKVVRILPSGRELIIFVRNVPSYIGEIEFMVNRPLVSSIVAMERSLVIRLSLWQHRDELMADSIFLHQISCQMADRLYLKDIQLPIDILYPVKERLAIYLMANEKNGYVSASLITISDAIGTSYRNLLRILDQFSKAGIIQRERKTIKIINEAELETLVNDK